MDKITIISETNFKEEITYPPYFITRSLDDVIRERDALVFNVNELNDSINQINLKIIALKNLGIKEQKDVVAAEAPK